MTTGAATPPATPLEQYAVGVVGEYRGAPPRAPIVHELKCWPEEFAAVLIGAKPYEHRIADRDFRVGDIAWLREWEPGVPSLANDGSMAVPPSYTGREVSRQITYITPPSTWGLTDNLCCLGIPAPALVPEQYQFALSMADAILQQNVDDLERASSLLDSATYSGGDDDTAAQWNDAVHEWQVRIRDLVETRRRQREAAASALASHDSHSEEGPTSG